MAPAAIRADRLVVHIRMTLVACGFCFGKDQGRMTRPAIYSLVLTGEGKSSRRVVESVD